VTGKWGEAIAIRSFVLIYNCIPQEFIMSVSDATKARAEALFKRKQEQAREGAQAWAEYQGKQRAVAENTTRLRALRLAKEAAEAQAKKSSANL
jgi:hypothetical protein